MNLSVERGELVLLSNHYETSVETQVRKISENRNCSERTGGNFEVTGKKH